MLCNQITNKRSEGFLALLFGKGLGNVAGHRIRPSCTHRAVNSRELFLWQRNGDFRSCHTGIIPSSSFRQTSWGSLSCSSIKFSDTTRLKAVRSAAVKPGGTGAMRPFPGTANSIRVSYT